MMEDERSQRTAHLTVSIFLVKLEDNQVEAREEVIKVEILRR